MANHVNMIDSGISGREKLIIAGLYLSRFDSLGLKSLGFSTFREAYNVIGYGLGAKPASIKNYRDEFDPKFPFRKGWHKREIREYCRKVFDRYKDLEFDSFTGLVRSFFALDDQDASVLSPDGTPESKEKAFAQRLITGLAAEHYFESVHNQLSEFQGLLLENTTRFGCGYDFRLRNSERRDEFLAVEVKGLNDNTGTVSMTPKEHTVATELGNRFFLFVVKNFRETPSHVLFRDPLSGHLEFRKSERVIIQVSWLANV